MQARIELGIAAPITPYVPDPLIQAVAQAANYNAAPVRFAAPRTGGTTAGKYTHPLMRHVLYILYSSLPHTSHVVLSLFIIVCDV